MYKNYAVLNSLPAYIYTFIIVFIVLELYRLVAKKLDKNKGWERSYQRLFVQWAMFLSIGLVFMLLGFVFAVFLFKQMAFLSFNRIFIHIILIAVFVSLLCSFDIVRYYFENWQDSSAKLNQYKKENAEYRFEILQNQVNPHFLFNSLNTLSVLIKEDDDAAVKFTQQLSVIYRHILDSRSRDLVNMNQEVHALKAYKYLLELRFVNKFSLSIRLDEGIFDYMLVPMSLQLLVENAVKHNVVSSKRPLKVEVYSEADRIVVRNNKQLKLQKESSTGMGLKNIDSRYKYFTNESIIVEETDKDFTVSIPMILSNNSNANQS
jgi:sensor histidine kinase YesM